MTAAEHLACPKCGSHDIRLSVRQWAVCDGCQYGGMWGEFMTCDCWGYDCPAIRHDDSAKEPDDASF